MTTGKTIALTRQTFVGKVTSLLFNMLSRLGVIVFLPMSKYLLISWLWSPSAVILESKKIKSVPVSTVSLPTQIVCLPKVLRHQFHPLPLSSVSTQDPVYTFATLQGYSEIDSTL